MDDKAYRRTVNAWCMYDGANSAFATIIMAAVLPIFYSTVAAILSPILGAIAHYTGTKKR